MSIPGILVNFLLRIVSPLILGLIWTTLSYGEGFRILDQSASATGQGAAFAAQADDPSAIHYNPAGMTQLSRIQFSAGTNIIGGNISFDAFSPPGGSVDGDLGGTVANPPPSQFYITANLKDSGIHVLENWAVGIGVTSPFGISTEYPDDAPFASSVTEAALPLMDIKPTLAYKVNKYLSVGGGLDIYTFADFLGEGQAELHTRSGPEFVPLGIPQNTPLEANGTDTALGFNASFLWTPFRNADKKPLVNVAFVYRSEADLDLDGDFLVNGKKFADASTTIELPDIYSGAIAVWPIRNSEREWKVEVDLDYADWSRFKNLDLELSNGITLPQPRNYDDSFVVMVGTEHKWLDMKSLPNWEIALRGGYVYSETPIPSNTFEPAVPDADYNAISIGLGMLCEEKGKFFGLIPCDGIGARAIGLDLAYQVLLYQTRGISDNINPAVNGEWDTTLHVGAINLRMNF